MQSPSPLWAHQQKAISEAKVRAKHGQGYAFFHDMGTGKTRTVCEVLTHLYRENYGMLPTLIICPLVVIDNWRRELLKYTTIPENFILTLTGPQTSRQKILTQYRRNHQGFVVISNYESLVMSDLIHDYMAWGPNVLVFDESQRLASPEAKRTKAAIKLSQNSKFNYILSGTPVLNSPLDLFSQYLVMDRGESFGGNFYAFRARYFVDKNAYMPAHIRFPNWQLRSGSIEEINEIINRTSSRAKKEECLDLPPLVRETIFVELSSEQKRLYEEMQKHLITYVNDKACVAQLALTKALRLQQIVSGFIKLEDDTIKTFENPRLKALKELLEDLTPNHKVIIWAVFHQNYKDIISICESLKIKYVECHGLLSEDEKISSVSHFTSDDSVRVFLGHPRSAGLGINLIESDVSIYYSRDFSLENDVQSEARNYRGGSERHSKVTRIDLVARGTIDELVLKSLANKEEVGEALLKSFKNG